MRNIFVFFAASFMMLLFGCKQEQPTKYLGYNKISIEEDTNWVVVTDTISFPIKCLNSDKIPDLTEFVIRDSNEYSKLQELRWIHTNCQDYMFPVIDFTQYTLLGLNTRTGRVTLEKSVYKNDSEKKYLYLIKIKNIIESDSVINEILIHNRNFLLVPKIPDNFSVEMDTLMSYDIK
jgi:hypothetical protein